MDIKDLKDHNESELNNLATSHKLFSKHTLMNYFPKYKLKTSGKQNISNESFRLTERILCLAFPGVIYIDERPPVIQCLFMGIQHVLAMFGSTVLGKRSD